jgi:S1-C subfamily serine protease
MTWTRIDFEPKEPFIPRRDPAKKGGGPPAELQAMQALGPIMKLMAVFLGRQPPEKLQPRGSLGMRLEVRDGAVVLAGAFEGTPAAEAGLKSGDRLVRVHERAVADLAAARAAVADLRPGQRVGVVVERDGQTIAFELTAGEGL